MAYGYAAGYQYGAASIWDERLEADLRREWEAGHPKTSAWEDVKAFVRRGYNGARAH